MAKFEVHKFDPVIFPRKVWIAKGGVKKDIADLFCDMDGDPYWLSKRVLEHSYAITDDVIESSTEDYGVLVWLHEPKMITTGTIAHEADHVANLIFKAIGATVDVQNDETHAYLVGFVANCIERVKNGKA